MTVTVKAPARPNACDTAPPAAVAPSPKFHAIDTGDTRSVAAAAMPIGAPTLAPGGTLELSVGAAASKLADWKRKWLAVLWNASRVHAATPLPWSSMPIDASKKLRNSPGRLARVADGAEQRPVRAVRLALHRE